MNFKSFVTDHAERRTCNINWKRLIQKRIPVTAWIPHYTFALLFQDLLAGFTVGLTEIPQAIAYAVVAGKSCSIFTHPLLSVSLLSPLTFTNSKLSYTGCS